MIYDDGKTQIVCCKAKAIGEAVRYRKIIKKNYNNLF